MSSKVIYLQSTAESTPEDISQKLWALVAILQAIDGGELLAALPECDFARGQHMTALSLLNYLEHQIIDLINEVSRPVG